MLWNAILEAGKDKGLLPCGLGARDTLRFEANLAVIWSRAYQQTLHQLKQGLDLQ